MRPLKVKLFSMTLVTAWESAFEQVAAVAARHRDIIDNVQATYSDVAMRSVVLVGRPTQMQKLSHFVEVEDRSRQLLMFSSVRG